MRCVLDVAQEPTTDARRSGAVISGVCGWSEGHPWMLPTVCRRDCGHRERAQRVRVFWASRKPEAAATPGKYNRGPVRAVNQCQRGEDRSSRPRGSSCLQGSSERMVSGNTRVRTYRAMADITGESQGAAARLTNSSNDNNDMCRGRLRRRGQMATGRGVGRRALGR